MCILSFTTKWSYDVFSQRWQQFYRHNDIYNSRCASLSVVGDWITEQEAWLAYWDEYEGALNEFVAILEGQEDKGLMEPITQLLATHMGFIQPHIYVQE